MTDSKTGIVVDDVHEDARAAVEELKKAQEPEEPAEPVKEPEPTKEPVHEPEATERARGPDGKFVKKEEAPKAEDEPKPADIQKGAEPAAKTEQNLQAPKEAVAGPPPGWSVPAKAAWDKIPAEVRDAIAKREQEVSSGFKQYEGLRPFAERAARGGQSLANVVQAYVATEDTLRRDPAKGFASLAERLGMTQHEYAQFSLQQAQRYGAAPQQNDAPVQDMNAAPQGFDPNALAPHIQRVVQDALRPFEQTLNQTVAVNRDAQNRAIETALERFRSDPAHRYFANVEDSIAQLFESGIVQRTGDHLADLAKAYEVACWQNPEIRAALINEQTAKAEESRKQREREIAAKAKTAGKSITGASVPAAIVPNPGEDDVTAAARAAYRQHALG